MDADDIENYENISELKSYADFLDRFVTPEDLIYLEDEELARDVKELYAVNKGEIRSKADFDRKKKELDSLKNQDEPKERKMFSLNMNYKKGTFLDYLQERESEVKNGRKSTIIFIRYKDKKGKETSSYIDYRERLKNDDMEAVFKEGKPLIPKPTDLSYYNWTMQKVMSNDSTFFRVDAGPKERLSFKNNTDRKIINVDLEYLDKHPNVDVKRHPITIKNRDGTKDIIRENDKKPNMANPLTTSGNANNNKNNPGSGTMTNNQSYKYLVTPVDVKKENVKLKKKFGNEGDSNDNWGYQQIVIFDYESRSK